MSKRMAGGRRTLAVMLVSLAVPAIGAAQTTPARPSAAGATILR